MYGVEPRSFMKEKRELRTIDVNGEGRTEVCVFEVCKICLLVSALVWAQSTTKDYIRAENKLPSISKLFISQVIMPQVSFSQTTTQIFTISEREPRKTVANALAKYITLSLLCDLEGRCGTRRVFDVSKMGDTKSRDSFLVELRTRDRKVASSNPGRSCGRDFFSRVHFLCWLSFGVRSTTLLPQRNVKDPGHSATFCRW